MTPCGQEARASGSDRRVPGGSSPVLGRMTRSHTHTDERGDSHGKESSQGREEEGRRKEAVTPETRSPWGAKVCAPVFFTPLLHAVPHAHTPHHVALPQLLDHFHPADHLAEDGVPSLEM